MIKQFMVVLALLIAGTSDAQARVYETTFRLEYPAARAVYVVASFNNWEIGPSCLMKRRGKFWSKTLNLEEGVYLYKFRVVRETDLPDAVFLMHDPLNPLKLLSQYGAYNSLLVVPAGRSAAQIMNHANNDIAALGRTFSALLAMGEIAQAQVFSDSLASTMNLAVEQFEKTPPPSLPEISDSGRSEATGPKPPSFDSTDINGNRVSLAELKGHVVLIDFWATWCGPCIYEMPHVKELYAEFEPRGLRIIGVSLDKDEAALRTYVHGNDIAWPQLFDGKGWGSALARAYGVRSIPATFLLDRNGRVAAVDLRGNELKQKVAELLQ